MPTPLFPEPHVPLIIKQGAIGDCYLLASLDCIFNAGDSGYSFIKSMFSQTAHRVTVRIKHTDFSDYLKPHLLAREYKYHFDVLRNEDVFIINKDELAEIDEAPIGVTTNALAVRILEWLASYYYEDKWDTSVAMASVLAHNTSGLRFQSTSSTFVGKLLGIDVDESLSVDEIIKLKMIFPDQPVYVSIQQQAADPRDLIHKVHAFRIDKIVPNPDYPDDYDFILANPWDNQRRERHRLTEIRPRICHLSIYKTHPILHELTLMVLSLSVEQGKYIFSTPELLRMILQKKASSTTFCIAEILLCIAQYQHAHLAITACIREIHELPMVFDTHCTLLAVDDHKQFLLQQLRLIIDRSDHLIATKQTIGLEEGTLPEEVIKALEEKSSAIRHAAHQKRLEIEHEKSKITLPKQRLGTTALSHVHRPVPVDIRGLTAGGFRFFMPEIASAGGVERAEAVVARTFIAV